MFAKLKSVRSAAKVVRYHELKVEEGKAELLLALNYLKDGDRLTRTDKLFFLERLNSLNERVYKNTLHGSLSFHPSEKMSNDRMKSIARHYMKKIGFDDQPYLVYRHRDTIHPHMHIVSTHVKPDGQNINIRSFFLRSRDIVREMEKQYNLIPTQRIILPTAAQASKVVYGQSEIKRSVNDVLITVMEQYKYTSLEEFNAILRLYNIRADQTSNRAPAYSKNMLLYRVLDENGHPKGIPLQSGEFSFKPTVRNLEKKMALNASFREESRKRITTMVDWSLSGRKPGIKGFKREMEKEGISVVLQRDKKGEWQGIHYVDHVKKAVFDGSSLDERYRVNAIRDRCGQEASPELKQTQKQTQQQGLKLRMRPW